MSNAEKALVINDLHFPFQCSRAIEVCLKVTDKFKPDTIFINGDLVDQWEISSFVKNPSKFAKNNLAGEINEARLWLTQLRKRFPLAKIIYIFGNHEYRWLKYIAANARSLSGLRGLTLEDQLDCPKLRIEVINSGNRESSYLWGKLLIGHFDRVAKNSAYTAKALIEDKGISLLQGHVHRGGSHFKRVYDRDIVGYENFCLCDRNPEYVDRPNWQLGFSLVYKDSVSDSFYVEQHPILEIKKGKSLHYQTWYNGEIFKG